MWRSGANPTHSRWWRRWRVVADILRHQQSSSINSRSSSSVSSRVEMLPVPRSFARSGITATFIQLIFTVANEFVGVLGRGMEQLMGSMTTLRCPSVRLSHSGRSFSKYGVVQSAVFARNFPLSPPAASDLSDCVGGRNGRADGRQWRASITSVRQRGRPSDLAVAAARDVFDRIAPSAASSHPTFRWSTTLSIYHHHHHRLGDGGDGQHSSKDLTRNHPWTVLYRMLSVFARLVNMHRHSRRPTFARVDTTTHLILAA